MSVSHGALPAAAAGQLLLLDCVPASGDKDDADSDKAAVVDQSVPLACHTT